MKTRLRLNQLSRVLIVKRVLVTAAECGLPGYEVRDPDRGLQRIRAGTRPYVSCPSMVPHSTTRTSSDQSRQMSTLVSSVTSGSGRDSGVLRNP